ncbi:MAG: GAF domain-containing protein [Thermonemataceae bacterium]
MNFKNIKLRRIAYFFGALLILLALVNFFVFRYVNISSNDVYSVNKSIDLEETAEKLNLAISIFIKQENPSETLAEEVKILNRLRAEYQAAFALLRNGGTVLVGEGTQRETYEIAPAPAALQNTFAQLERDWKQYQEDINLAIDGLVKANDDNRDIAWLPTKYEKFLGQNQKVREAYQAQLAQKRKRADTLFIILLIFGAAIIVSIYFTVRNLLLIPIGRIARTSRELSRGNLSYKIDYDYDSEIGYIARNVNDLADILKNATDFSNEIGKGNLEAQYKGKGTLEQNTNEGGIIGALQSMRDRLKEVAEKDRQERWVSTGLTQFADILRNSSNAHLNDLSYSIISNLVNYMEANQGILFVINEEGSKEYLQSTACYAINRRKYLDKKVEVGEGLLGQAYQDKETIYINDVPKEYEKVTSALGATTPRAVLIVPLMMNENVQGAVEILSLKEIKPYQISFVQRLAENIASTIALVKNSMKANQILIESEEIERRTKRRG